MLSQYVQEDNALGAAIPLIINGFIIDPTTRNTFMDIMRAKVITPVKNALSTSGDINTYKQAHATDDMAALYNLDSTQLHLIKDVLHIQNVPDLIDALSSNSGTVNIGINWTNLRVTRGAGINPSSNYAPVNTTLSYRLIDKNRSSAAIVGMGLLASYLANGCDWRTEVEGKDGKTIKKYVRPDFTGNAFAFSGNPSFAGARSILRGRLGESIYTVESNYLIVTNRKSSQKLDSVALIEHPINDNLSAFIGRKRYQGGPVVRNLNSSQLIFDRYTGAGLTYSNNKINGEAAWLYDSNPLGAGAERGATAQVSAKVKGAVIGANYLRAGSVKPGNGYSGSISTPLAGKYLEGYAEVGKGVDGAKIETYGLYFPSIYQNYDVDLFLEYGSHVGMGSSVSLCASHVVDDAVDFRIYGDLSKKRKLSINGGLIWKFDITGNKKK